MKGEFLAVWSATRHEIWDVLANQDDAPNDLYCELYRAASSAFVKQKTLGELAEIVDDAEESKRAFHEITAGDLVGERALCAFFVDLYDELDALNGEALTEPYRDALKAFISKYNLRYELVAPCKLSPTVVGIFSSLMSELRSLTAQDAHLVTLMKEFDEAICDLNMNGTDGRIKTCIQKQVNLLEGIAQKSPLVAKGDLAGMCSELQSWPHSGVKSSVACLYSFASDYPGIRHGGKPEKALRNIEMRDVISMSIMLIGCIPYLSEDIDSATVIWRK